MANYPQLDDCSGVWTLKEVKDAVMGGYWRNAGSRGLFAGGDTGSAINVIDYVVMSSTGNATDFGDLTVTKKHATAVSSHTRFVSMGGHTPSPVTNVMDYVTIMTTGNAADFGDLSAATGYPGSASNSTRGLRM